MQPDVPYPTPKLACYTTCLSGRARAQTYRERAPVELLVLLLLLLLLHDQLVRLLDLCLQLPSCISSGEKWRRREVKSACEEEEKEIERLRRKKNNDKSENNNAVEIKYDTIV